MLLYLNLYNLHFSMLQALYVLFNSLHLLLALKPSHRLFLSLECFFHSLYSPLAYLFPALPFKIQFKLYFAQFLNSVTDWYLLLYSNVPMSEYIYMCLILSFKMFFFFTKKYRIQKSVQNKNDLLKDLSLRDKSCTHHTGGRILHALSMPNSRLYSMNAHSQHSSKGQHCYELSIENLKNFTTYLNKSKHKKHGFVCIFLF